MRTDAMRIMTFNVRQQNMIDGHNDWQSRKPLVTSMIRFHQVDVVGFQEVKYRQLEDMKQELTDYNWVGKGRNDGGIEGEFVPIFYKKEVFDLLEEGHFWLSEQPESPGLIGWDGACTRMVTWVKLLNKQTGKSIYTFNTHFDHEGKRAVIESSQLIVQKIKAIVGHDQVILLGDFNASREDEFYKILIDDESSMLKDSECLSINPHHGPDFTFHGFMNPKGLLKSEREIEYSHPDFFLPIDYIFVSNQIKVQSHGILVDNWEGKFPSDHFPVVIDVIV